MENLINRGKGDQMKYSEKTIFVFDVCSSTTIVEDLHITGLVKHYNEMIKSLNDYLEEKSKKVKFQIYKFIGDGFILTFPGEIEMETILRFAKDLIDTCNQKITNLIDEYTESIVLPRKGITIGMDKGIVHQFELNEKIEFIGRALTLACRLQSSQESPKVVNSILMSVSSYSEIKDQKIKQYCEKRERTFKNITGNKKIKCYELFPLKLDFQETASQIEDMAVDTIVVPAREEGFNRAFLGQNCWYAIRISKPMIEKIKYIAAYQVASVSAITHYAEVSQIEEYQDTSKYIVYFKDTAKEIKPIKLIPKGKVKAPQAPRYTNFKKLLKAKNLDDIEIKDSKLSPRLPVIKGLSKESKKVGGKKKEISGRDLVQKIYSEVFLTKSRKNTLWQYMESRMVQIQGGKVLLEDEKSGIQFTAEVSPFFMDKFPVTQELYEKVMGKERNKSKFKGGGRPVETVTWFDAVEFCNSLSDKTGLKPVYTIDGEKVTANWNAKGFRLPMEAEWRYACRAGTTFDWDVGMYQFAWYKDNSNETSQEVGKKEPNQWGLYDMLGNVNEWCWDWSGDYPKEDKKDWIGPESGSKRVTPGGSWYHSVEHCTCAFRNHGRPAHSFPHLGFRLARSL